MTQVDREITIDDLGELDLREEQIEYFKKLQTIYENDILTMDPSEYTGVPTFSKYQLVHAGMGSMVNVIKFILQTDKITKEMAGNLRKAGVPTDPGENPMRLGITDNVLSNQSPI
jgi:hypothetical protein